MKITVLLKSGPSTTESKRAFQVVAGMLHQGHSVHLFMLQDAVHFCRSAQRSWTDLEELINEKLSVHVLVQDAELRGIALGAIHQEILRGEYEALVDLMESSDRVIGLV